MTMKTSEILTAALKHLWDGTSEYDLPVKFIGVCGAIRATKLDPDNKVRRELESRIGWQHSVIQWLSEKGFPALEADWPTKQDYRRRWVLSMIAEFQAKGD